MKKNKDKAGTKKIDLKKIIKDKRVKIGLISALSVIVLTGLIVCLWLFVLRPGKGMLAEAPVKFKGITHSERGEYYTLPEDPSEGAIIAYMFNAGVSDKLFREFFDTDTYIAPKYFSSVRMFADYLEDLDEAFGDDYPPYILLGIDPYASFLQSCSNKETYLQNLSFIRKFCEDHPYCMFIVQYPDDDAAMWNSLSGKDLEDARMAYIAPVREFYDLINVRFVYHSVKEWVLYPRVLRRLAGGEHLDTKVVDQLLAGDIVSLDCTLRVDTVNEVMDGVIAKAHDYDNVMGTYADLGGKNVLFLGDSVFGNYRDETAISTFFAEMTNSRVYNLGQGGISATGVVDPKDPVSPAFDYLNGKISIEEFDDAFSMYYSHNSYRLAVADLEGTSGKDSIILVELGLNDYLGAVPVPDYQAAMEKILTTLKSTYPEARIVVLVPGYVGKYEFGYYIMGEGGSVLPEYRDACVQASVNSGVEYINLMDVPGFEQDNWEDYLLLDGIHYNENGRYRIAQYLAQYFKNSKT